jgi:hypothetical protein
MIFPGRVPGKVVVVTRKYPELGDAVARGRADADGKVAAALYKRACGYDVERIGKNGERFTEHIPADFNAISLILRNRHPGRWRDRIEVVHDISDRLAERLESARLRMLERLQAPAVIDGTATLVQHGEREQEAVRRRRADIRSAPHTRI